MCWGTEVNEVEVRSGNWGKLEMLLKEKKNEKMELGVYCTLIRLVITNIHNNTLPRDKYRCVVQVRLFGLMKRELISAI